MLLRERKEVQEMPRGVVYVSRLAFAAALSCLSARGAIFPDKLGPFEKHPPKAFAAPDRDLYSEYGMEATEQAEYVAPAEKSDARKFSATAWRFRDSTGAMAAFESRRPPGAKPEKVTALSVATSDGRIFAYGNYVFQFAGAFPEQSDLQIFYSQLPKLEQSPLPAVMSYLPAEGLIPNSERYILGPVSLQRFEPRISPSAAAFHQSAEAQLGRYDTPKGQTSLVIFAYPTPNMARDRAAEFEKIPGTLAKRTGSLVAVIVQPPDTDAAERILAKINYQANMTWTEKPPENFARSTANMLLSIFALAGILIVFSVLVGFGLGGFRWFRKRGADPKDDPAMIVLDLRAK